MPLKSVNLRSNYREFDMFFIHLINYHFSSCAIWKIFRNMIGLSVMIKYKINQSTYFFPAIANFTFKIMTCFAWLSVCKNCIHAHWIFLFTFHFTAHDPRHHLRLYTPVCKFDNLFFILFNMPYCIFSIWYIIFN